MEKERYLMDNSKPRQIDVDEIAAAMEAYGKEIMATTTVSSLAALATLFGLASAGAPDALCCSLALAVLAISVAACFRSFNPRG
jgi:hypothetical protein